MRPSGGIGYTQHSGVNLPGLYAFHTLGLMDDDQSGSQRKLIFHCSRPLCHRRHSLPGIIDQQN
jgi:hypothetical protein